MPDDVVRVIAALGWAGLRHRPLRWVLLALGIAVASVLPVVARGLQLTAETAAIRATVDDIPAPARTVLASTGSSVPAAAAAAEDGQLRAGFAELGLSAIQRLVVYRPLSVAGSSFTLGAADGLGSEVRLTSGRLPRTCAPIRCEVLLTVVASSPTGQPAVSAASFALAAQQLGLVLTGTAELLDQRFVGGGLIDADQPLLLGTDVDQMGRLDKLLLFGRTTGWVSSINGQEIAAVGLDRFRAGLSGLADQLNLTVGALAISWPEDQVVAAAGRAVDSATRFGVLGAGAAVLQLGFCLSAAVGMRRRMQLVGGLLARRGASRWQLVVNPMLPVAVVVLAGLLVGALVGLITVAAASPGMPAGRFGTAGAALVGAWPTMLWLAAAAAGLAIAVALWPPDAERPTRVALDCLLVAAVGLVILVLDGGRGGGSPGVGPLTTSATTVISLAAGLVAARAWPLLVAGFRAMVPAGHGTAGLVRQLAVLGVQRRSLTPAVAAGFLAAATCSVVFAGSYQATLRQSAADQAAFQVPLDARLSPSRDVATPLSVLDAPAVTALGAGVAVRPLVTSSVTVFPGTGQAAGLPLIGLDGGALAAMHDFAAVTGSDVPPGRLAGELTLGTASGSSGAAPVIPAGSRNVLVAAAGINDDITVQLWVAGPQGAERSVLLSRYGAGLRGAVNTDTPLRVIGIELAESSSHLVHRQHAIGEGNTDHALAAGELTLRSTTVDGRPVAWDWTAWGSDTAVVRGALTGPPSAAGIRIGYQIGDARVVVSPGFVPRADLSPLPVLADPDTARSAVDGIVPVELSGLTIRARVVAVLPRMPTFDSRFLVADRTAVSTLLDRGEPGSAAVSQVWISAPTAALPGLRAVLGTPPVSTAQVQFRSDLEQRVAADPVATRSATLLELAGIIALLMGMVAMALSVRVDRQDAAADHLAWEVDGLGPPGIRRVLLLRVSAVLLLGIPIGAVAGAALTGAAVRLIGLGAAGTAVQPPLTVQLGIGWTATIVGAMVVACLASSTVTALTAFRERYPALPDLGPSMTATTTGSGSAARAIVSLDDVFVAYPSPVGTVMALRGLDLTVAAGERLLVQGPNGSGKSTLLRLLTGEQAATAGQVRVAGTDLHALSAASRRSWRAGSVGMVDQHARRALLPEWRVLDNVALQLRIGGRSTAPARRAAMATLDRLGLGELAQRTVATLSGGEAQRVAICAALAHAPQLILADEPTGELDEAAAHQVYALLTEAVGAHGAALVLVSHDRRASFGVDRAIRIRDGRVSEQWFPGVDGAESQVLDQHGWLRLPAGLVPGSATVVASALPGRAIRLTPGARGLPAGVGGRSGAAADQPAARGWLEESATGAVAGAPVAGAGAVAAGSPALVAGSGAAVAGPGAAVAGPGAVVAGQVVGIRQPVVAVLPPPLVPATPALELSAVTVRFGDRALFESLDLRMSQGERVVLRGPSGCGKSTLLSLAAGLSDATGGLVAVLGTPWRPLARAARAEFRRQHVAVALQSTVLADALTVAENLRFAARLRSLVSDEELEDTIAALAGELGLDRLLPQPVRSLSGGERQRVAVGRALVSGAALLLLDEPTSQQDEASAIRVAAAITGATDRGRTVIAASHDPVLTAAAGRVLELPLLPGVIRRDSGAGPPRRAPTPAPAGSGQPPR